MSRNAQQKANIFSIDYISVTTSISRGKAIIILFSMCRYAQSCAFISVIELPRIPYYCPKATGNKSPYGINNMQFRISSFSISLSWYTKNAFQDQNICSSYWEYACGMRVKTVDSNTVQRYIKIAIYARLCEKLILLLLYDCFMIQLNHNKNTKNQQTPVIPQLGFCLVIVS